MLFTLLDTELYGWACCWQMIFCSSFPDYLPPQCWAAFSSGRKYWRESMLHYLVEWFLFISCVLVLQAKCLESIAIKKVLQEKRCKNRELQTMRLLDHPNVSFSLTTQKKELFLILVLEYVPDTVYCIIKHYNNMSQTMPMIYVKLYTYQACIWMVL